MPAPGRLPGAHVRPSGVVVAGVLSNQDGRQNCVVRTRFRGASAALFDCDDLEVLIEGPARCSKTKAILAKLVMRAERYPKSRHLLLRQTRSSLTTSVLPELEAKILGMTHPAVLNGGKAENKLQYTFPNGSVIVTGGMDHEERLFSSEYDTVAVIECTELRLEKYETLLRCLSHDVCPYRQIIADCNPSFHAHWLNKRAATGKMRRLHARHRDNPYLWDEAKGEWTPIGRDVMRALNNMTGNRRLRLLEGKWATAEGVVYPDWLPSVHLIPRFDIPNDWRRIRCIDFGFSHPFVCLWIAFDPDGRAYVYRQLYRTELNVADRAAPLIHELTGDEVIEATVSDHDAGIRAILSERKIHTLLANKEIQPGIQAIEGRLRAAADKKPRLYVMEGSLVHPDQTLADQGRPNCLEQEFDSYVWAVASSGTIKELPVDDNNHALDALRYGMMYADRPSVFFVVG